VNPELYAGHAGDNGSDALDEGSIWPARTASRVRHQRRSDSNSHPVVRSKRPSRRPDLRSAAPTRGAAVQDGRRPPRSGAQRPGRPRARRHPRRRPTTLTCSPAMRDIPSRRRLNAGLRRR